MSQPDHVVGLCVDTGFYAVKALGAVFDGLSFSNLGSVVNRIVRTFFLSYYASIDGVSSNATGRIQLAPFPGISGEDAQMLAPGSWAYHKTEQIYTFHEFQQYVFQAIADIIQKIPVIKSGEHVQIFLSLGLAYRHLAYKQAILDRLSLETLYPLEIQNGISVLVSFANIEIESQLFWPVVDGTYRFQDDALRVDADFVSGVNGFVDAGSLTLQAGLCVNNMILVKQVSEEIGSWSVMRDQFIPYVRQLLQEKGIRIGSLRDVQFMKFYEEQQIRIGKYPVIDVSEYIKSLIKEKAVQRFRLIENSLDPSMSLRNIYLVGGDAYANYPVFVDRFAQEITGDVIIGKDDEGYDDPAFRLVSGGFKATVRRYLEYAKRL